MRLGQHFLKNKIILRYISRRCEGKKALEIGSGDGRLTQLLPNEKIYAVEIDERLCNILRKKLVDEKYTIICKDFLYLEPFPVDCIVGNVPYYISSPILFKLKEWEFSKAILMFQKEFAKKLIAKPSSSNYGRLSVTAQLSFSITYLKTVPKRHFSPPPKVDSAIVEIRKKAFSPSKELEDFIRKLFSHKNKKIRNIIGIEDERRPRELSPEEVLSLFNKLSRGDEKDL